jgi:hypothetical protein
MPRPRVPKKLRKLVRHHLAPGKRLTVHFALDIISFFLGLGLAVGGGGGGGGGHTNAEI